MKAWILDDFNGVETLRRGELPDPMAAAGEAVVEVRFASLNPADRYLAMGQYPAKPPLPHVLGRDGMGVVRSVGAGVTKFRAGDRVVILRGDAGVNRHGTLAELVAAPVEMLVEPPAGWSDEQSAAAPLVYVTAYQSLTQWGELPASIILISGITGGVGVAAMQLAVAMGHTVFGLSRSAEKGAKVKAMGATEVFDPGNPNWVKQLRQILGTQRIDLAIDNVGGEGLPRMIETLGMWGRVSVIGRLAGPVPEFNTATLFFRRIRIGGVAIGTYSAEESHSAWKHCLSLLEKTGARPLVDSVWKFEQVKEAFAQLEKGPMGKVVVKIGSGEIS